MGEASLSELFTWRSAICESDLPATTRHVALTLSLHMSERGDSCFPSKRTLADECGRTRRTVQRHVRKLVEQGWLRKDGIHQFQTPGGPQETVQYRATIPAEGGVRDSHPSSKGASQFREGGVRVTPKDDSKQDDNKKTLVEKTLWPVFLDELGGDGRQPQLTAKRRKKLRSLHEEQLPDDPSDAASRFRQILQAVQNSDHHMSKRAYQMPESLFRSEERRDRWAMAAAEGASSNGNGSKPASEALQGIYGDDWREKVYGEGGDDGPGG